MEAYFSTNNFITLPYHSSYWMGYQAPTWGASNFRTLDRWGLPVGPGQQKVQCDIVTSCCATWALGVAFSLQGSKAMPFGWPVVNSPF